MEITKKEAREMFLSQCRAIADCWAKLPSELTTKERIEGAIFSMLNIFDGTCGGFPSAIDLVLRPHKDDKQYSIDNDEDWIVDGQVFNDDVHLHSLFCDKEAKGDD